MSIRTAERRRSCRQAGVYPATLLDRRGKLLARGRTADISESGLLMLANATAALKGDTSAVVELVLPAVEAQTTRRVQRRVVRYACRIARVEPMGRMMAVGIELTRKLQ